MLLVWTARFWHDPLNLILLGIVMVTESKTGGSKINHSIRCLSRRLRSPASHGRRTSLETAQSSSPQHPVSGFPLTHKGGCPYPPTQLKQVLVTSPKAQTEHSQRPLPFSYIGFQSKAWLRIRRCVILKRQGHFARACRGPINLAVDDSPEKVSTPDLVLPSNGHFSRNPPE